MTRAEAELITTLVRMVVPMRREFGFSLDVHQFVHDPDYATVVLDKARVSADPKLREYAAHVESQRFGPRAGAAPAPRSSASFSTPTAAATPAPAASPKADFQATEDELRARMLRKYTTGLR